MFNLEILNSKHEIRNNYQNPNALNYQFCAVLNFEYSNFGFVSNLDILISNLLSAKKDKNFF